jgi:hypothetical protein
MSVRLWARNLLWLPRSISPNAIEIRRLWALSSLCCQQVLILLLISWSFRCKWAWERDIDRFLWVKVKERRPKHWYNYHALRDIGCFFKIVTCLSVGCPNCNSSWKVWTLECTKISGCGWPLCRPSHSLFPSCKIVLKWRLNHLRACETIC